MKTLNPRIERLKQLLALEERSAALQKELDSLSLKISSLKEGFFDDAAPAKAAPSAPVEAKAPAARKGRPIKRAARGALRDKVMAALEAAGSAGVKVKTLALTLGTKPVNVHSWFHSALKKDKAITKITGGHYRLSKGGAPSVATSPTKPAKTAKPAKAAKAPKAAKPATKGKRRGGAKRGELTAKIRGILKSAGTGGISVADLATKLNANYKNIYIWFATTGKKHKDIKKVGPARYSLEG